MESKIVLVSISAVILTIAMRLSPMLMQETNAVSMSDHGKNKVVISTSVKISTQSVSLRRQEIMKECA